MRTIIVLTALLFMAFAPLAAQQAPEFTLKDTAGADVALSSFKGKIVVLDFWAMWCQACKEAFGHLNGIQKEFGEKGVTVVGVDVEKAGPEKVKAFLKKAGIAYPVLLDPEMATGKLYGLKGIPTLVVIGRDMGIVKTFRGMNKSTEKEITELLKKLSAQ
jgi:peroxiredoxin